jgi:hypothetical protein
MADSSSSVTAAPNSHGTGRWHAALFSKWAIHSEDLVIRGGWPGLGILGLRDSWMPDEWFILCVRIRGGIPQDRRAIPINDG